VQDALGSVVGGLDAVLCQKNPERIYFAQQAAGKPPRPICMVMLLVNQLTTAVHTPPAFLYPMVGALAIWPSHWNSASTQAPHAARAG
jgi:hypothetical protein